MKSALLIIFFATHAFAGTLDTFKGNWKEVSWRCPGSQTLQPRPSELGSDKFLSIGDNGTYFHRVQIYDMSTCTSIQSAGMLSGTDSGKMIAITVTPQLNISCVDGQSTLMDDFALPDANPFNLYLETVKGTEYLVFNGDPTYVSSDCQGQIIERLYQRN